MKAGAAVADRAERVLGFDEEGSEIERLDVPPSRSNYAREARVRGAANLVAYRLRLVPDRPQIPWFT